MKIMIARVVFDHDENESLKKGENIPTSLGKPRPIKNQICVIQTHDQGESLFGAYLQSFFYIDHEEKQDYPDDEIDFFLNDNSNEKGSTAKLVSCVLESGQRVWYQPSQWIKKKEKIDILRDGDQVDEITTAGVYTVSAKYHGISIAKPLRVCVLPSSMSKVDFDMMLTQLTNFFTRLPFRSDSKVGADGHRPFEEIIPQFLHVCQQIMRLPGDTLKKQYERASVHKLKRFDAHVMRDYSQHAASGIIDQITYTTDVNTPENQLIKSFLRSLLPHMPGKAAPEVKIDELAKNYENELWKQVNQAPACQIPDDKNAEQIPPVFTPVYFHRPINQQRFYDEITIEIVNPQLCWEKPHEYWFMLSTTSQVPFISDAQNKSSYLHIALCSKSQKEIEWFVHRIDNYFKELNEDIPELPEKKVLESEFCICLKDKCASESSCFR